MSRNRILRMFGWDTPALGSIDPFDWESPPMSNDKLDESVLDWETPVVPLKDVDVVKYSEAILELLLADKQWHYRSAAGMVNALQEHKKYGVTEAEVSRMFLVLEGMGLVVRSKNDDTLFGHAERIKALEKPVEMSKSERSLAEAELWEKNRPIVAASPAFVPDEGASGPDDDMMARTGKYLDPQTFEPVAYNKPIEPAPGPAGEPKEDTVLCESPDEGMLPQHRRQHRQHLRGLRMVIDSLPTNLIVKAIADAIAHNREVAHREHIKADRSERVNQFIVSLRRQFGYMGDTYRTEREYLSAQLARKEVWYDVGVLNPPSISRLDGYSSSLKSRDVEAWVAQAEAMAPSHGDLKAEIERDLEKLKGSILVAESCNKTAGELNKNADKVLGEMAALASTM